MNTSVILRKTRTLLANPKTALLSKLVAFEASHYTAKLERAGAWDILSHGRVDEIEIVPFDLWNIYNLIRTRKPRKVLEFGIGFSTIVIAHALHQNGAGHVWSVNVSQDWIDNTLAKMPEHLGRYSSVMQSNAIATTHNGELCHMFENLPNIAPDFLYLDGPSAREVTGSVRGLSFIQDDDKNRPVMSADIFLLESSMRPGALILVDGRNKNMEFLRRNLRRRYRHRWDRRRRCSTFELIDRA